MESLRNIIARLRKRYEYMLINLAKSLPKRKFAFCESTYATSTSPWHIRKLTDMGLKLGGGADTKALCGREMSWDIECEIIPQLRQFIQPAICRKCVEKFEKNQNAR